MKNLKKKVVVLVGVITLMAMSLMACSDEPMDKLEGTWKVIEENGQAVDYNGAYVFNDDGTGSVETNGQTFMTFTYEATEDTITMKISLFGATDEDSAKYSIDDDILTMTKDDETIKFEKQ